MKISSYVSILEHYRFDFECSLSLYLYFVRFSPDLHQSKSESGSLFSFIKELSYSKYMTTIYFTCLFCFAKSITCILPEEKQHL